MAPSATLVIPCLYNSFSFTNENITTDKIVVYDILSVKSQVPVQVQIQVPVHASVPVPVPVHTAVIDTPPTSDTDEDTADDSSSATTTIDSEIPPSSTVAFHPDIMTSYGYKYPPSCSDSILWSVYIMLYGTEKYETIENPYVESNRFKFELIEVMRQNKPILKANKIKLGGLEESLVHKPFITLETLQAIAVCKSISVCIVQNRKYYEIDNGGETFIIEKIKGNYVLYIAPIKVNMDYLTYIRENYWLMENISAPIRPLSAYKLQDLVDISQKLNLPVVNVTPGKFGSMGTEKCKTKPELYEAICKCV
jgi:hypothetical protein